MSRPVIEIWFLIPWISTVQINKVKFVTEDESKEDKEDKEDKTNEVMCSN